MLTKYCPEPSLQNEMSPWEKEIQILRLNQERLNLIIQIQSFHQWRRNVCLTQEDKKTDFFHETMTYAYSLPEYKEFGFQTNLATFEKIMNYPTDKFTSLEPSELSNHKIITYISH